MLSAIRDAVVPPNARGFNYDIVEGKPSAARIVALAQTLPMLAQRRLIYVRDISALRSDHLSHGNRIGFRLLVLPVQMTGNQAAERQKRHSRGKR